MPNRIPTPGIKAPTVRKSPTATPAAKPKATPTKSAPTKKSYPRQDGKDRPAVGNDKEFAKKYGSKSWNNGYTN